VSALAGALDNQGLARSDAWTRRLDVRMADRTRLPGRPSRRSFSTRRGFRRTRSAADGIRDPAPPCVQSSERPFPSTTIWDSMTTTHSDGGTLMGARFGRLAGVDMAVFGGDGGVARWGRAPQTLLPPRVDYFDIGSWKHRDPGNDVTLESVGRDGSG
jgi:hypothetical protein